MPTYDYICDRCGIRYEKFQNMSAEPDTECPECGGIVRRLIGAGAGLIFKGNGFYQTDYKSTSPANECPECSTTCSTCPAAKD
ncbi:MAG: zinc ribbon domain-containing protein [Candidatus Sabulitectum sp.]|nr:zinc ribbon domain-containing protein [Candidatus Sabulitectum sp.]